MDKDNVKAFLNAAYGTKIIENQKVDVLKDQFLTRFAPDIKNLLNAEQTVDYPEQMTTFMERCTQTVDGQNYMPYHRVQQLLYHYFFKENSYQQKSEEVSSEGSSAQWPNTPTDFINQYSFYDQQQMYTLGAHAIAVSRVYDMINHYFTKNSDECKVITLCGSTKFKPDFMRVQESLTDMGYTVLAPTVYSHYSESDEIFTDRISILNKLRKNKILLADLIVVIDSTGYIGNGTNSEINFAREHGTPVVYMSSFFDINTEKCRLAINNAMGKDAK